MAYDLSNPTNVNNYVSGYQGYVPQNGSLGMPSAGWDGWNNYNNQHTYNFSGDGIGMPSTPPGYVPSTGTAAMAGSPLTGFNGTLNTPTMGGMPNSPPGQNIKAGRPDLATMTSALTGNYLQQYQQQASSVNNPHRLQGIITGLYNHQMQQQANAARPPAGTGAGPSPIVRGLGNVGSTTQVDASGNDMTPAAAPPPTPYGWFPGENMSYASAIKNNSTNVPGLGYIPNSYFQNNSNGSYIQSQPMSTLSQYTPPPMPPAGSSGSSIGYGANGLYWNQG